MTVSLGAGMADFCSESTWRVLFRLRGAEVGAEERGCLRPPAPRDHRRLRGQRTSRQVSLQRRVLHLAPSHFTFDLTAVAPTGTAPRMNAHCQRLKL